LPYIRPSKHEFSKLWAGQTVSRLGSEITLFALPTLAVLVLRASPAQLGILGALEMLPFPVLGLLVGVWVDRLPRRGVLIAADIGRFFLLAAIPAAAYFGVLQLWHVYVVGLGAGICTVFFDVAYQSYLPALVEREELPGANARLEISNSGSKIAGNALGGVLVQSVGAALAVGLDALSYVVSVLSLLLIRKHEPRHAGPALTLRQLRDEIGEGLHLVLRAPDLRRIAFATGTTNFGGSMAAAVMLIFASRTLHVNPGLLGILFGVANLGFAGALFSSRLRDRFGLRNVLILSLIVAGAANAVLLLAALGAAPLFIVLSTAISAIAVPIYNVNQISYRQAIVEASLQGRLNATIRTFVWGTIPLGSLAGGYLATLVGVEWTIAAGSTLSVAAAAWLWGLRERPVNPSPAPDPIQ
jgi:MFS family permease